MAVRMSGLVSGLDTESIIKELMDAQRTKSTKIENKITKLEWKQDKWKSLNSKIYSFYTGSLSKAKMQGNYLTKKATSSNENKIEVNANNSAPEGSHTIKVKSVASAQFVTGAELNLDKNSKEITNSTKLLDLFSNTTVGEKIQITVGIEPAVDFTVDENSTVGDFTDALEDAGLNASYDSTQKRFFISSKESGTVNAFSITSGTYDLTELGLGADEIRVEASDAVVIYNGAELTSSSNMFTANGLTFTIKGVTEGMDTPVDTSDDEVINISITNDTQAVYDMVKEFVNSYSELLKGMNEVYYADSSRGYEPLTDEEKDAMGETQIEKWEDKIKDSLLRRDNTVGSIISSMRSTLGKSVTVNGKSYSLSSFGITSVNYTEKGVLHINGDKDDQITSAEENDLITALTEDPEAVMEVFTVLAGDLYDSMTKQMKSTTLSSALTFYNDKEMNNTLEDYQEELNNFEDRLQDMEDRYYNQFTAMEKALSKMNAQSSSFASLLGMNTQQ